MNDWIHEPEDPVYQEAKAVLEQLAHPRSVDACVRPLLQDGRAVGLLANMEDTLGPGAELANWTEQSLRSVIDLLPDGVVVVNAEGIIILVNRQTEQMFGYGRDEMLGRQI